MTIGTSLFHQTTTRDLSKITEKIATLQGEIASGKNDPRASADPVRALRLSAAHEQDEALTRFATNLERAGLRLEQADIVMEEGVATMRRISELGLRAMSDTMTVSDRKSIGIEVEELRAALLGIANARDTTGQPLFGGYATQGDPFQDSPDGVKYHGDSGQSRLQVSETKSLPTGVAGDAIFMGNSAGGDTDVFALIDTFMDALDHNLEGRDSTVTVQNELTLDPPFSRQPKAWTIDIAGPQGRATVTFDIALDAVTGAQEAINAQTAVTGVSAARDPATGKLVLSAAGDITLAGLQTQDGDAGPLRMQAADGSEHSLVAPRETPRAILEQLQSATDHLIDQRTRLGAYSTAAETHSDVIEARKFAIDQTLSNLEDLDITDALTRLQQSMLTRDATLQAYVKITQKSLFDYMR